MITDFTDLMIKLDDLREYAEEQIKHSDGGFDTEYWVGFLRGVERARTIVLNAR